MKTFTRDGVTARYPADWALDLDDADSGWTATLQSRGTAFAVLSLRPDADRAETVADETLAALRAEYPGLDADPVADTLAGSPAVGFDIDFLALDTVVTCRVRAADTTAGPLLVMTQVGEFDAAEHDPVLRAIVASVALDE
jgi:hypothetical protein